MRIVVRQRKDWLDLCGELRLDDGHVLAMRELEPEAPSTVRAQLRDYQVDSYRWLARLAHGGAGVCLADDMGLGKTIQALALILSRSAAKGELADDLLEGTEEGGRLSYEELLALVG